MSQNIAPPVYGIGWRVLATRGNHRVGRGASAAATLWAARIWPASLVACRRRWPPLDSSSRLALGPHRGCAIPRDYYHPLGDYFASLCLRGFNTPKLCQDCRSLTVVSTESTAEAQKTQVIPSAEDAPGRGATGRSGQISNRCRYLHDFAA